MEKLGLDSRVAASGDDDLKRLLIEAEKAQSEAFGKMVGRRIKIELRKKAMEQ